MHKIIVKQEDETDCGACSLLSIIKYYDGYVPLEVIKVDTLTNKNGTTFYNLKEAAIKYGFEVNGLHSFNINAINKPFIAQVKLDNSLYHFVVVYKVNNNITLMDPSVGIKEISKNDFFKVFTGYILCLNPINKVVKYSSKNPFINIIKLEFFNYKKQIVILSIVSILLVLSSLFTTYGIKIIITNHEKILVLIFILLVLINIGLNYIKNLLIAHLNKKFSTNLIANYLKHIFYLPYKYLQLKKAGEISVRVNDLNNIKTLFTKELMDILINLLYFIGSLIILFCLNNLITLIIMIITFLHIFILIKLNKKIYNLYLSNIDSETILTNKIIEYIDKINVIKNLNKEKFFFNKIIKENINNCNNYYSLECNLNYIELFNNIYLEISLIIILFINLFLNNSNSNILIYILFYNYFSESIKYFINLIPNFMYFKSIFNKIGGLYYLKKENLTDGLKFTNGKIMVNNLSYKINLNQIFNHANFIINKGDKVLLTGSNGSGKSTLLNILFNNINDYDGEILINNTNIKNINLAGLHGRVSFISQDDALFNDTIINNIILDEKLNNKKISIINKIVDLDSIIINKLNGINAFIDNNLSGGEKQRIILARSLYKDFDILFMDEALSEVSYKLRLKIINNLNYYFKDKTIIFVSHNYEKFSFDKVYNLTVRKDEYVNW